VKGNVEKKETTRNSTLIDKMRKNLEKVHIADFSCTDIESNSVTL